MGLDLVGKLQLMQAMLRLSHKSSNEIVITETNWPITNTYPYAPTGEGDCVSLEAQADFLVRYYLLALTSGVVKNVYWHQLIAPGYGLVDNRESILIYYPSYTAFKVMLSVLQDKKYVETTTKDGLFSAKFTTDATSVYSKTVEVLWCNDSVESSKSPTISINNEKQRVISRDGITQDGDTFNITGSPIYVITDSLN